MSDWTRPAAAERTPRASASSRPVPFGPAIFLASFLLFELQPMMGKIILPWFGGGPAVWSTCLLFFQAMLVSGYAYAHWLGSRRSLRLQAIVHIGLLAVSLVFLPVAGRAELYKPATSDDPALRIAILLGATAGLPYLLLAANAPLLQRWFTLVHQDEAPWRYYSLSNAGSLLALLSYPFLLEPLLRLGIQRWVWSILYAAFAVLCARLAWRLQAMPLSAAALREETGAARPGIPLLLFWTLLAACGSALLVATTNQLSQEITVNPFLWVAPLSIYLVTFILTFESARFYRPTLFAVLAGLLAPIACAVQSSAGWAGLKTQLGLYLGTLFVICMICHGELRRARPPARYLTHFYLTIAIGGALGGSLVTLVAPRIFVDLTEFPIVLGVACLLGFYAWLRLGALAQWTAGNFRVRLPLMALLLGGLSSLVSGILSSRLEAVTEARNFYGILRVTERQDDNGRRRELKHGRVLHGFQYLHPAARKWPTTYYGPHSGAARALQAVEKPDRRVALIGLGAGTMAAWGRPGDLFRFFEINPDVERIARAQFSYLNDSPARVEVVLGDARVQLEAEAARGVDPPYDAILVDAFSSDAIPVHLLTAECGDLYRKRLASGGMLLLHISNVVLNLKPVARGLARHMGWPHAFLLSSTHLETGEVSADWVLITANAERWKRLGVTPEGGADQPSVLWTDDYASLWSVLKF